MTYDFLELQWRVIKAQDVVEDSDEAYYLYRDKTINESSDLEPTEEVIEIVPVAWGSTVDYMKENWGMQPMLEEIGAVLTQKIEYDRKSRSVSILNLSALLSKTNPNEGRLQLMYEYNSYQSNRPDDPVEYDEHFELVCFVDDLMKAVTTLRNIKKKK